MLKFREGVFVCLNDKLLKKKFSFSVVNDDFCDCEDGTDEPGTRSAHLFVLSILLMLFC